MGESQPGEGAAWSEADSEVFADQAAIFVPGRDEQIQALLSLLPARSDEAFTVVELGAGNGALARAILGSFPRCRYLALDGSAVMRARLAAALSPFGARAEIRAFALEEEPWRAALPRPLRAVLASLIVHHLSGPEKRKLFADLAGALEPSGALLLADIVEAPTERAAALFARQWDDAVRAQSLEKTGGLGAFEVFDQEGWNYYRLVPQDPVDQPSRLSEQLDWLKHAGLSAVDCFWMRAGHAIYGGYR
jgi:tRNA (cmo5U34)-methyltransferase